MEGVSDWLASWLGHKAVLNLPKLRGAPGDVGRRAAWLPLGACVAPVYVGHRAA